MTPPVAVQDLSRQEAAFLAAIRGLWFGRFEYVQIRDGQLVLDPWPTMVREIKFAAGHQSGKSAEASSDLRPQVAEFFSYVRGVGVGEIRELGIRHGLPFSMEVELPGRRRG
jgi:hypothetical protein